jgi:hypothetical protein
MNFPRSPFYIIGKLIVNYIFFIIQYIRRFNAPPLKKPIEIPYVETQYDKSCKKYANFYNTETPDENSNIDPVLYDFDKRKEIFVSVDNEMEKQC